MTDFVDDLEAELLRAARRRSSRPRLARPRILLRPALVLAAALAAFAFVVRGGAPDPERPASKMPAASALPVAGTPAPCDRKPPVTGSAPERVVRELALLRRPRTNTDLVDGSRLPIEAYDPESTRRVGPIAVVPASGICQHNVPEPIDPPRGELEGIDVEEANAMLTRAREGACVVFRERAARCFTLDAIRAGKAFALVEASDGARIIGLVPDGTQRVAVLTHGAAAALQVDQNTVDDLFKGLKLTDEISLELDRRTEQVLVLNQSGTKGRAEIEATRLRARLDVGVRAEESELTREDTVVSSTSTKSNGLARKTAQFFDDPQIELAPGGLGLKPTTPGVIVAIGKDRMR